MEKIKITDKSDHCFYWVEFEENGKKLYASKVKRSIALRFWDTKDEKQKHVCKLYDNENNTILWYGDDKKIVNKVNKVMKLAFWFTHKPRN